MPAYEFISFPAERGFTQVIREARDTLFIATPYIKDYGVRLVLDQANVNAIQLLTNLDIANITGAGFDLAALLRLWNRFELEVSSLGKLHAKVYVADRKLAFVTSANLTRGGMRDNYEYGVILRDEPVVAAMLEDMTAYFNLGNLFGRSTITGIQEEVAEIANLQRRLERSVAARRLRKMLTQKQDILQTKILANRTRAGRTVNAIFADTIKYLLNTRGPMSTQELHPLIQNIHPDICDDSIDRIINGENFGKRWKHLARNAQQYLKQSGAIQLSNGKWHLTDPFGKQ